MFDPLYNRAKLEKRLESLYKGALQDISASHGKIREHVTAKLEALSRSFKNTSHHLLSSFRPLLGPACSV